jgi:hypothetical protein
MDPEFLYRYCHLDGDRRDWTRKLLIESVIYFPPPSKFNDPFDCKVHFDPELSLKELKKIYQNILLRKYTDLNRKERREKSREAIKNVIPEHLIEYITNNLQNEVDKCGVLSLSATDRNILLWSHYAAGHKGLCLKFIATSATPFFGRAQRVYYFSQYPQINILDPVEHQIEAFFFTKALDWSYEQEWRIIDHEGGHGYKRFPEECLAGVILGAQMDKTDREIVINWINQRKPPFTRYEAKINKTSYALDIEELMKS